MSDEKKTKKKAAKSEAEETKSESKADSGEETTSESKAESSAETKPAKNDSDRKRKVRGLVTAALGLIVTFLLMSHVEQIPHGVIFGFISLAFGVFGLLEYLGLLHVEGEATELRKTPLGRLPDEPVWAQPLYTVPVAIAILFIGSVAGGYETLPWVIAASLFTLFPSAVQRPGLLVFVVVGFIYLPKLGTFGLWDPWETHYGEVAREMVARDDYISLWWAQENWFWSKPILIFWSESLTFNALHLPVMPDANPAHPEWAVRLPVTTFSICAVMVVYATIRKLFSQRAGAISALVLATMPHFFFLSHQAITDMYLVSNLVMALCMLMLAFATDPAEKARTYRIFGGRTISFQTIVVGGLMMLILPQALYLISLNVEFFPSEGFRILPDTFMYGSAGNPGGIEAGQVPGNPPHRDITPHVEALQPALQGLFWILGLVGIVWMLRKEKRSQALFMTAFYGFCALSFMGKGIPGFALPGLIALLYLIASRRWNVLFDGQLRIAPGALIVSCVGLPWYIAMYIRHGPGFTDRLLVHDHLNRLAAGVHGDTGSIQYFIWQLGYATFPWVALIPAAALAWVWLDERRAAPGLGAYRTSYAKHDIDNRKHTLMLIGIWFFAAFTLFSAMITKFHHYIFPAVPPAAILVGLFVDRLWGHDPQGDDKVRQKTRWATIAALASPVFLVTGIGGFWGDLRGLVPRSLSPGAERQDWVLDHGMSLWLCYLLIFVGATLLGWAAYWFWRQRTHRDKLDADSKRTELSVAVAVGAGAVLVAFVGRDLAWVTSARPGGYERLIHLFVYNYGRPWPDLFDYRPILTGFAIGAGLLLALAALRYTRAAASRAMVGLAIIFAGWTLNFYMVDLAPHWGMRELFKAYYDNREGPEEPVIAWQMNWKGENFYTGNRVFAFVDLDNAKIREWMSKNRGSTAFFVMEHSRVGSFRNLVRGRDVEHITDKDVCNKFVVLRVRNL